MTSEYSIDRKKFMKPIKDSKWFYTFLLLGLVVNWFLLGLLGIWIVLGLFGMLIIFQIVLQLQYFIHDRKIKLIVSYGKKKIEYSNESECVEILFEEIESIHRFKGSKYSKPFEQYVIPSNFYHWTRIKTKNGETYSFSSFVKDDLNIVGIRKCETIVPFLNIMKK
jgi:hypothetical protein